MMLSGVLQAAEPKAVACKEADLVKSQMKAAAKVDIERLAGDGLVVSLDVIGDLPALVQPELSMLSKVLRSRMVFKLRGRSCDGGLQLARTVWFGVQVMRDAWVYGRNARQGSLLSEALPQREPIDIAALQLAIPELAELNDGQRLIVEAYAGRPVLKQHLTREPSVRRGQPVAVVVRASGLELRMPGTAMQSGRLGDAIAVQFRPAQASMPATIASQGEVHVDVEM